MTARTLGRASAAALLLGAWILSTGCVLHVRATHPPHHRHHSHLNRAEAVTIASRIAVERGYVDFVVDEVERKGGPRWEVEIDGWVHGRRGELEVVLDAVTGRVLKVKDKRKGRGHGRGHHDD